MKINNNGQHGGRVPTSGKSAENPAATKVAQVSKIYNPIGTGAPDKAKSLNGRVQNQTDKNHYLLHGSSISLSPLPPTRAT